MRFHLSAIALGIGALVATPCLALTISSAPPRPDIAQHLHGQAVPGAGVLPAPDDVKDSFAASEPPQIGKGFPSATGPRTTSFSFGPVRATTTLAPGYDALWDDTSRRDNGNPLALTPRR